MVLKNFRRVVLPQIACLTPEILPSSSKTYFKHRASVLLALPSTPWLMVVTGGHGALNTNADSALEPLSTEREQSKWAREVTPPLSSAHQGKQGLPHSPTGLHALLSLL
jgi:hypothetical protein